MPSVSLIVEALRARPAGVFWAAALAQAFLWVLVPALFYASPPGDLPEMLAIGHEGQLGSWHGPPLAFWLAELAFQAAGARPIGAYVLAQVCVLAAYWAIFALGRTFVGAQHAAMAVLLMSGVLAFSAPTPEFGPAVLAMPLTGATLLCFWRAIGEGRRNYWVAFAFALGLLLLATYWGLVLAALLACFMLVTREGRAALATIDPWAAVLVALLVPFPHFAWLWQSGVLSGLATALPSPGELAARLPRWLLLLGAVLASHIGLAVLIILASGWRADRRIEAPEIERPAVKPFARRFVFFLALALPLAGTLAAAASARIVTPASAGQLVLMSGLAVIVAAGNRIVLHRQDVLGATWFAVLLLPPILIVGAMAVVPWTVALELSSQQPAAAMGHFFSDIFRRRTGAPLEIVAGDSPVPYLIAAASTDRPRVFMTANPERTPWLDGPAVQAKGAIVVWRMQEATGEPPAVIRARFPELVAEIPQTFERPVQGLLPPYRIGWGLIRPQPTI